MDYTNPAEKASFNRHAAEDCRCEGCGGAGLRECAECGRWLCSGCLLWREEVCEECLNAAASEAEA